MAGSLGPKGLSSNSKASSKSIFPSDFHKSPLSWLVSSYFHCIGEEIDAINQRRSPLYQSHILRRRAPPSHPTPRTQGSSWQLFPLGMSRCHMLWGEHGKTGSGIIASSDRKEGGAISSGAKEEKPPEVQALIWPVMRALFTLSVCD